MPTFARRSAVALFVVLLLPAAAFAQAAITGVVKDASGAVLPGVTVEAASSVLIEKTRSVVTDDTGQYRIVDLRPGTYTVTFTLPGFSTVKREGIELSGDFVATVNGDLQVGNLEETITVTGESPIVDVQSARVQTIVDRDVLTAIPSSRNATGIQALVPGMSANGDAGGITGGSGGMAGFIHGARASDSRTLHDGINTGWAGANSNAAVSNVAGAQEVVMTTSGGLGEAETAGVMLNIIPRDGGNQFSGTFAYSGCQRRACRGATTPTRSRLPVSGRRRSCSRCGRSTRWAAARSSATSSGSTRPTARSTPRTRSPACSSTRTPAIRRSGSSISIRRVRHSSTVVTRNAIGRLTWQVSPRNKISLSHSEQYDRQNKTGGGAGTRTPEAQGMRLYTPGHIQTATWTSPFTNRLLFEGAWGNYLSRYANFAPRVDGSHNDNLISVVEQCSPSCPNNNGYPGNPRSPESPA